ncbi:bifunctional hydroxymethylpyrimidine kinase/phosphomethylpyrimidine kinase [Dellaglioa algida]|uniref:bifunctional hydroxymethylpyrimidine kinase/phosphomethylpyrimidine kinase n=1 Tax=Dellaglioa algida TaxID=105612 RepID=UPI000BC9DA4A|nr:PfkB family carbohydrate kinase [Dellaglioa algida]MDK1717660.1 PfkB family carbohydrate kinase [Dellaglioa algida]MDK1729437.1 PfkB family carbohydrate kinase [Dellaglioa algida]MDK1741688.1 PfkB family carbohydrate kinase [Dellaglioa algida]SOB50768.1 putative Phosphomethylpyrimidine kinase [Dellaglioa algida]
MVKQLLIAQDLSSVGGVSLGIAVPVLASYHQRTTILPTMLLSSHTGGFGVPVKSDTSPLIQSFKKQWATIPIQFTGAYLGYLGTIESIKAMGSLLAELSDDEKMTTIDPVMADHGHLYSGMTTDYVNELRMLCLAQADLILPNLTEAYLLAELDYQENPSELEVDQLLKQLLKKLNLKAVVITGVTNQQNKIGVAFRTVGNESGWVLKEKREQHYFGTGDLLASCVVGELMTGKALEEALRFAVEVTWKAMSVSDKEALDGRLGVNFMSILPDINRRMGK